MNAFGNNRMFAGGSATFDEAAPQGANSGLMQQWQQLRGQLPQGGGSGFAGGNAGAPGGRMFAAGGMGGRKPMGGGMGGGDPRAMALRAYGQRMQGGFGVGGGMGPQDMAGGMQTGGFRPPVMPQGDGMAQPAVMPPMGGGDAWGQPPQQGGDTATRMPPVQPGQQPAPQGVMQPGAADNYQQMPQMQGADGYAMRAAQGTGNQAGLDGAFQNQGQQNSAINQTGVGGTDYKPWLNQLASQGLKAPTQGAMADQWASEGLGSMQGGQWNWAQGKGF